MHAKLLFFPKQRSTSSLYISLPSDLTSSAMEPRTLTMPRNSTTTTAAQRLADLPAITSSLLDLSTFVIKKLTTLPSDLTLIGLEEYRALVCRELASAHSRTPGVFEQAVKEEHDFKNAQKVQLEMLINEVQDLIQKAMEVLQMVIDAKPVFYPNMRDERITEDQQRTLLSSVRYHEKPPSAKEQPCHPLDGHIAGQRKGWEELDLGSRLDLLKMDDRLAEADLETLRCQIIEMEKEKERRLEMIRDLKEQCARKKEEREKEEKTRKEGGMEGIVGEEEMLPIRMKSEDEDKARVDDEEPWIT